MLNRELFHTLPDYNYVCRSNCHLCVAMGYGTFSFLNMVYDVVLYMYVIVWRIHIDHHMLLCGTVFSLYIVHIFLCGLVQLVQLVHSTVQLHLCALHTVFLCVTVRPMCYSGSMCYSTACTHHSCAVTCMEYSVRPRMSVSVPLLFYPC
jgi:hypothetical protein